MDIEQEKVVSVEKAKTSKARRLLDLDVKEVSLVDRPANLREFLVVKRLGGEKMSAFAADNEAKTEAKGNASETEIVKMNADGGEGNGEATDPGTNADAGAEGEGESGDAASTNADAGEGSTSEVEVEKALPKEIVASLKAVANFAKGANAVDKAALQKAGFMFGGKDKTKKTETKKSEDGNADAPVPAVQVMQDGSVLVSGQPVVKSKSFTQSRIDSIKSTVSNLVNLIGDVDPAIAKAMLADLSKALPADTKFQGGVKPVGTMKSEDGNGGNADPVDVASIVQEAVSKAIAPVTERIEKIEKARAPSKSVDDEGKTDSTVDVQKNEGGMWKGVL